MDKSPLIRQSYLTDAAELHTYIIKFTLGNPVAEGKMVQNSQKNNRRLDFIALNNHYKGFHVRAIDIVKAENILQDLLYSGEKKQHMWWNEFMRQLTDIFNTYGQHEKRSVHSYNQKLHMLNRKINSYFLQATKSYINLELARTHVNLSYDDSLAEFRNQVNQKYPLELSTYKNRRARILNEVYSMGGGRGGLFQGRGRGCYGGRGRRGRGGIFYGGHGRGGQYGRGGRQNFVYKRSRSNARMVQCNDGTQIEVHPACELTTNEWFRLPEAESIRIRE